MLGFYLEERLNILDEELAFHVDDLTEKMEWLRGGLKSLKGRTYMRMAGKAYFFKDRW